MKLIFPSIFSLAAVVPALFLLWRMPPLAHAQALANAAPFYCWATNASGVPINNSQRICFPLANIDVIFPDGPTPMLWMRGGGELGFPYAEWDRLADYARANGMPDFPDRPGR